MSDASTVLKTMKDDNVEYLDLRFTDPRGKMQHVTLHSDIIDEDFFAEGFMFDGSSIAGWKGIEKSDMKLMPDASSMIMDPFYAQKTVAIFSNVVEPDTGEPYDRDPRGTAVKAENHSEGHGDRRLVVLGARSRVLHLRRRALSTCRCSAWRSRSTPPTAHGTRGRRYEMGNMGHRPGVKGGYFPVNPTDSAQDMRSEMLLDDEADRHEGGQAPPRGRRRASTSWA